MSSISTNFVQYILSKLKRPRSDQEDLSIAGPSSCKQRRISGFGGHQQSHNSGAMSEAEDPYRNIQSRSSVQGREPLSRLPPEMFLSTNASIHTMRKNKHTIVVPAAHTSGNSAPGLYPLTNGNHHQQQQQQYRQSHKKYSRCFGNGGAKSPPPQLLPAVQSRFSRVPPNLLPMGSHSSGNDTAGLSSYGLKTNGDRRPPPPSSLRSHLRGGGVDAIAQFFSSTPKWSTSDAATAAAPMSLQRSVLVDANDAGDYTRLASYNGCNAGDSQTAQKRAAPKPPPPQQTIGTNSATRSLDTLSSIAAPAMGSAMNFMKYSDMLNKLDLNSPNAYINLKGVSAKQQSMVNLCDDADASTANRTIGLTLDELRISEAQPEPPKLPPVNSLQTRLESKPVLQRNFSQSLASRYDASRKEHNDELEQATQLAAQRQNATNEMARHYKRQQQQWLVPDDSTLIITPDDELTEPEPEVNEFPTFTTEQRSIICNAMRENGPKDETLITKFSLSIRRKSLQTLAGLNWLDDEIINFYMNLLMERSERRSASDGLPKVYAFNTFFLARLTAAGHAGVRRWTRKVDIFAYDVLPVPVHVGGVHWCMAIIDFRDRSIRYYDSMISRNPRVLDILAQYLVDEYRDKKGGGTFDISDWRLESMLDIPQQNNQSDCGVFSCAFAETFARGAPVRFSQQNMPWMRMKMVLEICTGEMIL